MTILFAFIISFITLLIRLIASLIVLASYVDICFCYVSTRRVQQCNNNDKRIECESKSLENLKSLSVVNIIEVNMSPFWFRRLSFPLSSFICFISTFFWNRNFVINENKQTLDCQSYSHNKTNQLYWRMNAPHLQLHRSRIVHSRQELLETEIDRERGGRRRTFRKRCLWQCVIAIEFIVNIN